MCLTGWVCLHQVLGNRGLNKGSRQGVSATTERLTSSAVGAKIFVTSGKTRSTGQNICYQRASEKNRHAARPQRSHEYKKVKNQRSAC